MTMTADWKLSPLQNRVIGLCFLINIVDGFDILALAYTAPAIGRAWSLGPEQLGILFSVGLAGMMAGSFLLGPLADRFGQRPLILTCLLLAGLSMIAAAFSGSLTPLLIARAFTGLAVGGILPCINTMVAEYAPQKSRALAVSIMQAGFGLGATLGGFVAVVLLSQFGWPSVFVLGGLMTFLLIPAVYFGVPESLVFLHNRPARHGERDKIIAQLGDHGKDLLELTSAEPQTASDESLWRRLMPLRVPLLLVSVAFFMSIGSFYFLSSWTPKILVDGGLPENQAVIAGALLTFGSIVSCFVMGWLSLRRSILPIVLAAMLLSFLFTVIFGLLPIRVEIILIGALLLGLAVSAAQVGIYAVVPSLFPGTSRAGATGIAIGIGRLGAVAGPGLAGFILASGASNATLFTIMAVPYLLGAVAFFGLKKWQKY